MKPTGKNYARAFVPSISKEAYLVHELVKDLNLDRENIRNLLVYLVNSASDPETVASMLELCEKKRSEQSTQTYIKGGTHGNEKRS